MLVLKSWVIYDTTIPLLYLCISSSPVTRFSTVLQFLNTHTHTHTHTNLLPEFSHPINCLLLLLLLLLSSHYIYNIAHVIRERKGPRWLVRIILQNEGKEKEKKRERKR
ncbi:hypothetical protein AAHE18_11G222500 [Arachis hypogaea]